MPCPLATCVVLCKGDKCITTQSRISPPRLEKDPKIFLAAGRHVRHQDVCNITDNNNTVVVGIAILHCQRNKIYSVAVEFIARALLIGYSAVRGEATYDHDLAVPPTIAFGHDHGYHTTKYCWQPCCFCGAACFTTNVDNQTPSISILLPPTNILFSIPPSSRTTARMGWCCTTGILLEEKIFVGPTGCQRG